MAIMPWIDSYALGVTWIDDQHKRLVDLINALHQLMLEGARPDCVEAILEDLLAYTDSHFAEEERAMEQAGFAGFTLHRFKHQSMRAEVEKLKRLHDQPSLPIRLMEFLKSWLARHICETDREYVPALRAANLG